MGLIVRNASSRRIRWDGKQRSLWAVGVIKNSDYLPEKKMSRAACTGQEDFMIFHHSLLDHCWFMWLVSFESFQKERKRICLKITMNNEWRGIYYKTDPKIGLKNSRQSVAALHRPPRSTIRYRADSARSKKPESSVCKQFIKVRKLCLKLPIPKNQKWLLFPLFTIYFLKYLEYLK